MELAEFILFSRCDPNKLNKALNGAYSASRIEIGTARWEEDVGPLAALTRKPRATPGREVKITGEVHARITPLACSKPPAGHARRTLRLLARHLVEIEVIETISHQSVATVLKKVNSSHGGKNAGASHPSKTPPS
jgi:hypothetical protein